jgi:hypothetical protein
VTTCRTGKICHPTRDRAERHKRSLLARYEGTTRREMDTWKCRFCDHWHVGHRHPSHAHERRTA